MICRIEKGMEWASHTASFINCYNHLCCVVTENLSTISESFSVYFLKICLLIFCLTILVLHVLRYFELHTYFVIVVFVPTRIITIKNMIVQSIMFYQWLSFWPHYLLHYLITDFKKWLTHFFPSENSKLGQIQGPLNFYCFPKVLFLDWDQCLFVLQSYPTTEPPFPTLFLPP